MKILKFIGAIIISITLFVVYIILDKKECDVGSSLAEISLGISLPYLWLKLQDLFDTTNWKTSQRKLLRGGFINSNTIIRISFAYLYRIKVDNKYLLVLNSRGTKKYQPVGGVYKYDAAEQTELRKRYHIIEDDKIKRDSSSQYDYRLQIKNKYLRRFVFRFNHFANREKVNNLGREFKEELIDTGILHWTELKYRICGRHIADIQYSKHFQIYELMLADVVEPLLTPQQEADIRTLMQSNEQAYRFANEKEIKSLGIDTESNQLVEIISDHTIKILQEYEDELLSIPGDNKKTYTVTFS